MLISLDNLAQKQIVVSILLLSERLSGTANQQMAIDLAHEFANGLTESEFRNCRTAANDAYQCVIRV
jgi:hypothetical protein